MSFSSLLHLLLHLLILSPSSLSSPPRREETLNYQQISHKPVDKPQSIGGIIPSSSERPRKQNNEREILQNIKMSELLQGVFLTGVLNLKLSVRSATLLTVHSVFSAAHCRWSFQWFSWYCSSCFDSCCDSFPRTYNYWGSVRSREFSYTVCVRSREFSYTVCVRSREFSYTAVYD